MLSIDPIVHVNLHLTAASPVSASWDTGLLLGPSEVIPVSERYRVFTSAEDMVTAGFTDTMPELAAARLYFSAVCAPRQLLVARWDAGSKSAEAGVEAPATDKADHGSAAEAPAAGKSDPVSGASVSKPNRGRVRDDPTPAETPLDALKDVIAHTESFYGVTVCGVSDAQLLAINAYLMEKDRFFLFCAATGTPAQVVAPGSLLSSLKATESRRCLALYSASTPRDAAAVMGVAMGLNLANPTDAFALCYAELKGVTPADLTESEVTAIKALNGNVYVSRGVGHALLEQASTPGGLRYDNVLYLDRIRAELQEACVDLLAVGRQRVPMTDTATAVFFNVLEGVLEPWYEREVLTCAPWRGPDTGLITRGDVLAHGYYLWADSYDRQTEADRAAHRAMPISVCLCMAGAVESIVLDLNLQF